MDSGTAVIAVPTNQSTTVTLATGNAKIRALFALKDYTLTLQKTNTADTVFPYPSATVQHGIATSILVKPVRGSHFTNWTTVVGLASFADSAQASTSVTLTNGTTTIRAVTVADAYMLTMKKDSGSVTVLPAGKTTFAYGDTALLIAAPSMGYRFSGWSGDTLVSDSLMTSIKITFVKNLSIIANFTKKGSYSLLVSGVGGRVTKSPDSSSYSNNDRVALTAIPDSVHQFDHWSGDASGTANPCTVTVSGNKSVIAIFAVRKFLLTMQNGGHGSTTPAASDSILVGTPRAISDSVAAGYRFVKWSVSPANAATIQNDTSATGAAVTLNLARDVAVLASYNQLFSVSFYGNGNDSGTVPVNNKKYLTGDTVVIPAAGTLKKVGYNFSGWDTSASGSGIVGSPIVVGSADVKLYAKWMAISYTIAYNLDNGTNGSSPATSYTVASPAIKLPIPVKTGCVFGGWFTNSGLTGNADSLIPAGSTGNKEYWVKWLPIYTVSFDAQGATNPAGLQVVPPKNTLDSLPTTPTKTGYTFAGWYTAANGGGTAFTATTVVTTNLLVYAKWIPQTFTVSFDGQGGSTPANIDVVNPATTVGSLPATPLRAGYTFVGWFTAPSGGGTAFTATTTVTASLTVYAQWNANPASAPVNIIPLPNTLTIGTGTLGFAPTEKVTISCDVASDSTVPWVVQLFNQTNIPTSVVRSGTAKIVITMNTADLGTLGNEGYKLSITGTQVIITAPTTTGQFYAVQTLRQLFPADIERLGTVINGPFYLNQLEITDKPRFVHRGCLFDPVRHWCGGKDSLLIHIDRMALYKLNRLHILLSDDQGFRIESLVYPNLNTVGSNTQVGGAHPTGGTKWYFTQQEMKDIVSYAKNRKIEIIPEIQSPGHCTAMCASYPNLGTPNAAVQTDQTTGNSILNCSGANAAYVNTFMGNLWREMSSIFPYSQYHIGGSETFNASAADYNAFMLRMQDTLLAIGKQAIGWQEITAAGLRSGNISQSWSKSTTGTIFSPCDNMFLDNANQTGDVSTMNWCVNQLTLQNVYSSNVSNASIKGIEGVLYTEEVSLPQYWDRQFWPRLAAVAEVGWAPTNSNYAGFQTRIGYFGARMSAMGITYYITGGITWNTASLNSSKKNVYYNFVPALIPVN